MMVGAKFTIKNYRCFSEEDPLRFELGSGFTSFIGPNNTGKSFILKFFYEFRLIWNLFLSQNTFDHLLTGGQNYYPSADFTGVTDTEEVFYKFSQKDIQIELEIGEIKLSFVIFRQRRAVGNVKVSIKNQEVPINSISINFKDKLFNCSDSKFSKTIDASQLFNLLERLTKCIYIPSFRNAINVGTADQEGKYFDIWVGSAFIDMWNEWKVGRYIWQSQKIQDITEHIRDLFGYKSLEINAAPQLKTLKLVINGQVYKLPEIGSGITHFILVLASVTMRESSFILIDEPELNLHPVLQQKFLTSLASYSKEGILFATHSIGLARSVANRIYSVTKPANFSIVRPFEKTPNYAELLGEMNFTAYQELGVEKVLLVEGPTDVTTFQQLLRIKNKDKDFVIIPLGGSSMINGKKTQELALAEIKRITPKIFCWFDSERNSADAPLPKNREEFLEICKKLNIKIHASDRRAIENYFTDQAVRETKGNNISNLGLYEKLDPSKHWLKEENWRIAQKMKLEDFNNTDLGKFISEI